MIPLSTRNTSPIPILTYHQIAEAPPKGTPHRSLCVSPTTFRKQMAFLALMGYQGLSMTALQPYLRGERTGKVVGITLDDGYLNNLVHAAPVLRNYGFSSTCYVVSQLLGKTNVWDQESGIPESALMDATQLREWVAGGQEVGAHTRHHAHLCQLDANKARDEITMCKKDLEDLLGSAVEHFCYPYGEYTTAHAVMVTEAGYRTATTTQRSRCIAADSFTALPRVPVARRTTRLSLWLKLATDYEDRRRR
jgi:peptidoglycan/xylan/chitin deacetylase (PgdA/CDA1 family)